MVKHFFLATTIIGLTTSVAFAYSAPYVGASVGIATNTSTSVATGVINGAVQSSPGNFRGMPFDAFIGYGGCINQNFYLAGELFATFVTAEFSNSNNLKTTYGYGVGLLPGIMLSDHTIAYGRVGALRTRFSSGNSTQTGGQLGLGLQTSVTQNVDLRGEYDFSAYRSFSNASGKISSPKQDAVHLGLIYKFD